MTNIGPASIDSVPTPEEAAAIMAALKVFRADEPEGATPTKRSRWRIAGLLGHAPPPGVKFEGSLWAYSSWKDGL